MDTRKQKEAPKTRARREAIEALYQSLLGKGLNKRDMTGELAPHFEFFVKYLGKRFFMPGAEAEDLAQEARSGLSYAGESFSPDQGTSFYDYATMCMRNSVLAAVRKSTREKQKVLSEASSFEVLTVHPAYAVTPDRVVESRLMVQSLFAWMDKEMSALESDTLRSWLSGVGVSELSERLNLDAKKVENALFRARKKAKDFLVGKQYALAS